MGEHDERARQLFREEAAEQLSELSAILVALERDPEDMGSIGEAFRICHSLKGASRLAGFDTVSQLAHALETSLQRLRDGAQIDLPAELGDLHLAALDTIRALLEDGPNAENEAKRIIRDLSSSAPPPPAEKASTIPPALRSRLNELRKGFASLSLEELQHFNHALVEFERTGNRDAIDTLFRITHSLKGAGASHGMPEVTELSGAMESIFERARQGTLEHNPVVFDALLMASDALGTIFSNVADDEAVPALDSDLLALLRDAGAGVDTRDRPASARPASTAPEKRSSSPKVRDKKNESIRIRVDRLDHIVNWAGELTQSQNTREAAVVDAKAILRASRALAAVCATLDLESGNRDHAVLSNPRKLAEALADECARFVERFDDTTARAGRVSMALQDAVLGARMVPLTRLFGGVPRLVRDLGRATDKKIDITIDGETTELDRRIVEAMSDPLIHLVRNAVDHGLETPDRRRAAGKSEVGRLSLSATRQGRYVHITLVDDGGGLVRSKILARAVERQLVAKDEAEELTDDQVNALIFQPGFSTRSEVSEISGRGVGMDIVQTRVAELGGFVAVTSVEGEGTTFDVRLPISVASVPVFFFRVDEATYGISSDALVAVRRLEASGVVTMGGEPFISQGETLIPLRRLCDYLGEKRSHRGSDGRKLAMILRGNATPIAFEIDEVLRQRAVVVRDLGTFLRSTPLVAGCTLLASGEVVMVLDPSELVLRANQAVQRTREPEVEAVVAERPKVLVADDSLTAREVISGLIRYAGYEVDVVENGRAAWERLNQGDYQALVTDVEMPELDGFELVRRIRADGALAHLPVIIISALANPVERRKGLDAGANAYVTKSKFSKETLLDWIATSVHGDRVGGEP